MNSKQIKKFHTIFLIMFFKRFKIRVTLHHIKAYYKHTISDVLACAQQFVVCSGLDWIRAPGMQQGYMGIVWKC